MVCVILYVALCLLLIIVSGLVFHILFYFVVCVCFFFFFQAEDGIRDLVRSRGLGDVYKRQALAKHQAAQNAAPPPGSENGASPSSYDH